MWDHLRNKYYNEWLDSDPEMWVGIALKLEMIKDLRELLRKFDNAGSRSA